MQRKITRRAYLGDAALGAGVVILANSRSARTYAANEKLNLAAIGCGGRGRELISTFCERANIVAMCDVNESRAAEMYRKFPDVPKFKDFRKMLDDKGKEIEGVFVATPDHVHAVISAAAIRAGKHVYTEAPLTRLVKESRVLRNLAREKKIATSMGNQGTASGPYRRALELIQNGADAAPARPTLRARLDGGLQRRGVRRIEVQFFLFLFNHGGALSSTGSSVGS
jgi:predicted dehydrogenase